MSMVYKTVLAAAFVSALLIPAGATIDNADLGSLESEYNVGEEVALSASAGGSDIQELRIQKSTDDGFSWTTLKTLDCLSKDECETSATDEHGSEGSVKYRLKAVSDTDTATDVHETQFVEQEDSIDSVDLQVSDSSPETGENIDLDAEATGDSIDNLRIQKSTDGGFSWTTLKSIDCLEKSSCDTSTGYSQGSEGDVKLRARAVTDDDSDNDVHTVSFSDGEGDTSGDRIDDVDVDVSDTDLKFGEEITIDAEADGRKLEELRIQKSTDEFAWKTLKSIDCLEKSSCDTSTDHTHSSGEDTVYYRARIVTENHAENDVREVSYSEEVDDRPSIDLRQPFNGEEDVSRKPLYKWKIADSDDHEMEDVTLYVEEKDFSGDEPWNVPDHIYDIDNDAGTIESFRSPDRLEAGQDYVWGIKADDGEHVVKSEVYSFSTEGKDDDDDQKDDGSLTVTVRDGESDRLENAHVKIENGDHRTDRTDYQGEAEFVSLDPDWYDIRVKCDGEVETDRVHVGSGEAEELTVRMDRHSSDDYCDDDADRPEASFTVSDSNPEIGQRVRFDASGSEGDIMEYRWAFPDGTIKYGEVVYKSFDSAGKKNVQLRVTEYDYDQDRTSRELDVQRRDEDVGDREDPVARLDIDPSSAEIGEEVEFDATDSSDDEGIELYEFDLDGDGDWDVESDDGEVERTFFDEFDGFARVRVTDEDGNTDIDSEHYEVRSGGRVVISDVKSPEKVCGGESFQVDFNVRNLGDERYVVVEGRGFGETRSAVEMLDEDEEEGMMITFNAGSPGSKSFTLSASNSNTERRTVEVLDCEDQVGDVSDISVSATPTRVNAGEAVKVSGYVDDTRGRKNVRILMDGSLVADTSTSPDGYYQVYAYPEGIGRASIVASSDGMTARTSVEVLPTVQVSSLEIPDNIFQGESFEVCGQVTTQADALVLLRRNGEVVSSKHGNGKVCFDTVSNTAGETQYSIGAYARGAGDSFSREVEILENKPETSSFPGKIASVESGDGIVKATIYNNHDEQRRYDVDLWGLPDTWVSTSEKQVILQPGEQREVFFYLTPQREGTYLANIRIESQGATIYDESVEVITGGTSENQERSIMWRLRHAVPWW